MKALLFIITLTAFAVADSTTVATTQVGQSRVVTDMQLAQGGTICRASTTCINGWGQPYPVSCYVTGPGCYFSSQYNIGVACTGYGPQGWMTYWVNCH